MPPPISELSASILERIFALFCPHCHPPRSSSTYWGMYCNDSCPIGRPEHERRLTLANLCLTNKPLNSVATPILYHRFHRRNEIAFARTLFKWRPDLTQHVKSLHLGSDDELTFTSGNDELVLKEVTTQLDHLRISQDEPKEDESMLLSLLIGKCANIEDLCLTVTWNGYYDPVPFCPPGSLRDLKRLSLSHWDDNGGFDLAYATEIFLAAPNITSVFAYAVIEVGMGLKMANVTEITLRNSFLQIDAFNRLLKQLPSLEKLTYYGGDAGIMDGETPPRARDVQEAILKHAPRLKFLKLVMLEDDNSYYRDDGITDEDMMRSLKGLEQLQELRLDAQYLVVPCYEEDETDMETRMLVNMLPDSIRLVGIECGYSTCSTRTLLPAILELGRVCQVEFPHLRSVRVSVLDDLEEARELFESNGVEFITEYV
ncbi:hypothetical protein GCG54_00008205 [Colletotrichum gloeosporioides]|uniref:F-box domain-containing protein n=1 Tax=Colletotrichum gloeosporioides TaxID=474922 RepID=A0A8H4C788_COLGL|nr:uncharacterized protein GCG54_00008205 [Colletotrichum gloeosporioides]KAF3798750.1 hypothetical protein GCG54_00008205 [Colletotrichum gloeosporioides]